MKKVLALFLMALFIASSCYGVDINDWKRGDASIPVKGTDNISDADTLISNYIVDPLDKLLTEEIHGCTQTYATAATTTIGVGEVTCYNSAKTIKRMRRNTSTVTITLPASGASGSSLDTGNAAISTMYYVYAVADADATTFTGICSASATSPTGYTYFRKIGAFYNNASDNIDANSVTSYDSGKIIQVVNYQTGAYATGTTVIPNDNTIPQKTEGDEYMTLSFTPTSATNKLKIDVIVQWGHLQTGQDGYAALFQDTANDALAVAGAVSCAAATQPSAPLVMTHYMTAGTTNMTTFKVRCGATSAAGFYFNGSSNGATFNGTYASSITITEIQT